MVGVQGFEPGPPGPKPGALPDCATLRITGTTGRNRTGTPLKTTDFKSVAATDYATVANIWCPRSDSNRHALGTGF